MYFTCRLLKFNSREYYIQIVIHICDDDDDDDDKFIFLSLNKIILG